MSLCDLAVINETGDPLLRSCKVKLKLFYGYLMKPCGVPTLKTHQNNTTKELDFQIVETVNKPLLSAEICVKLGLLKLSFSVGPEPVNASVPLTRERIPADYKDVFKAIYPPVQHAPRWIPVTLQRDTMNLKKSHENALKTHECIFNGHENRDFRFHGIYLHHEISMKFRGLVSMGPEKFTKVLKVVFMGH